MNPAANSAPKVMTWGFRAAWAIVGAATVGWVLTLRPVWASKPDLADRFLVPLASAWLIWRAWPQLRSLEVRPNWWGAVPLVIGAFAFTIGWYVAVQVSGRPIVVWWLSIALMLLVLGLALLLLGPRHTRLLIFPVIFIAFSLPTPGRVYNPLMLRLKQFTTSAAQHTLPWLGVPVERPDAEGFELLLPSGSLGVVEACSGVRSVTALTAIAVLVAYLRGFGVVRGMLLVGLTVGVIALTNALRVVVTGLLQEYLGRQAIEGWAHDALGVSVVLVGFALIVILAILLAPRSHSASTLSPSARASNHAQSVKGHDVFALVVLVPALAGCLWSEQFRLNDRVVVRLHELPTTLGPWLAQELTVPDAIQEELMCDQIIRREYEHGKVGEKVHVWVMFWANAATTAHMHHPDICFPSKGWQVTAAHVKPIELPGGVELPISVRHYVRPENQKALFFWTQHGGQVLADGVEKAELFSGHSWLFDLLRHGHQPIDSGARFSVLIGTTTRGSTESGEKLLRDFTQRFAGELYRSYPWATPKPSPTQ